MQVMRIMRVICLLYLILLLPACLKVNHSQDPVRNFAVLWEEVDKKYSLFERKNINWAEVKNRYAPLLNAGSSPAELFEVLKSALSELKDGHVNLTTPTNVFSYKDFYLDYYPNFNPTVIRYHYLGDYDRVFGGVLPTQVLRKAGAHSGQPVLYLRYASFNLPVHNAMLATLREYMQSLNIHGLIIDIRSNTGGNLDNAQTLAGFLHRENFTAGYIKFKTGSGHQDFSDFARINTNAEVHLDGLPVIVLTDRLVYSAANFFAGAVKGLANVTLLGDRTGGGGGMPYSNQLPNGWDFTISVNELFDPNKAPLEPGIAPDIAVRLRFDSTRDNLIDTAYYLLNQAR